MEAKDLRRLLTGDIRRGPAEMQRGFDGTDYVHRVWWFAGGRLGSCVYDPLPAKERAKGIRARSLCPLCGFPKSNHAAGC